MDCLRSGLEGTAAPTEVDDEPGLPDELEGGPPKKSSPNSESAALPCLGGAVFFVGGALAPGESVVFGLAGGVGTSPNKSI